MRLGLVSGREGLENRLDVVPHLNQKEHLQHCTPNIKIDSLPVLKTLLLFTTNLRIHSFIHSFIIMIIIIKIKRIIKIKIKIKRIIIIIN